MKYPLSSHHWAHPCELNETNYNNEWRRHQHRLFNWWHHNMFSSNWRAKLWKIGDIIRQSDGEFAASSDKIATKQLTLGPPEPDRQCSDLFNHVRIIPAACLDTLGHMLESYFILSHNLFLWHFQLIALLVPLNSLIDRFLLSWCVSVWRNTISCPVCI